MVVVFVLQVELCGISVLEWVTSLEVKTLTISKRCLRGPPYGCTNATNTIPAPYIDSCAATRISELINTHKCLVKKNSNLAVRPQAHTQVHG